MALDDSKTAMGLGSINNTVTSIISNVQRLAGVVESTLLPKVQAVAKSMGGINQGIINPRTGQTIGSANKVSESGPAAGPVQDMGGRDNRVMCLPPAVQNLVNMGGSGGGQNVMKIGRAHV